MTEKHLGMFVRKATGLVREISLLDAFSLCGSSGVPAQAIPVLILWGMCAYPGADILGAVLIGGALSSVGLMLVYASFSATMPRSGGDYIFLTRLLSPLGPIGGAIGFAGNFSIWLCQVMCIGACAEVLIMLAVAPILSTIGFTTGSTMLINVSQWFLTPTGLFITASVVIWAFSILYLTGVKRAMGSNTTLYIVGIIGVIAVILILLASTNAQFVSIWNNLSVEYGSVDVNPYESLIMKAKEVGVEFPPVGTVPIILALAASTTVHNWSYWSTYVAGEFKNAHSLKRHILSMSGATMFNCVLVFIAGTLLLNVIGRDFIIAATVLGAEHPELLLVPVSHSAYSFVSLLSGNVWIALFIGICIIAGFLGIYPMILAMTSRTVFAWSFDRMMPEKFAEVSERFHAPIWSIIITAIIANFFAFLWTWYIWVFAGFAFGNLLPIIAVFIPLGILAIIFPWFKKSLYERSPIKYEIIGIPVISIAGVFSLVYGFIMTYSFIAFPGFGLQNWGTFYAMLFIYAVGVTIYGIVRYYRKRHGVDIDMVFKEIPPE